MLGLHFLHEGILSLEIDGACGNAIMTPVSMLGEHDNIYLMHTVQAQAVI